MMGFAALNPSYMLPRIIKHPRCQPLRCKSNKSRQRATFAAVRIKQTAEKILHQIQGDGGISRNFLNHHPAPN
jgi:hypothetical protein